MHSAVIPSILSHPALLLAEQLVHQRYVHLGPLVLKTNPFKDVNSWAESACYPRSTFYPLSDGPSTRDHRITMTDFRLCSNRRSRSQAGLCHCTQRLISDQSEPTFARLRYSLGGDRPSQTTRHAGSLFRLTEAG